MSCKNYITNHPNCFLNSPIHSSFNNARNVSLFRLEKKSVFEDQRNQDLLNFDNSTKLPSVVSTLSNLPKGRKDILKALRFHSLTAKQVLLFISLYSTNKSSCSIIKSIIFHRFLTLFLAHTQIIVEWQFNKKVYLNSLEKPWNNFNSIDARGVPEKYI